MKIYNVFMRDDEIGTLTLSRCTTKEKAEKAKRILEKAGYNVEISVDMDFDTVYIEDKMIEL